MRHFSIYKFKSYWQIIYWFDLGTHFVKFCDISNKKEKIFFGVHDGL